MVTDARQLIPAGSTPVALELPDELSFDQWEECGRTLNRAAEAAMWWLGDWWAYGERRYGDAAKAAAVTGYALKTIQRASFVANKIELTRRRVNLRWSHHAEVSALDPELVDDLLDKASVNEWTVRELRAEVRKIAPPPPPDPQRREQRERDKTKRLAAFGDEVGSFSDALTGRKLDQYADVDVSVRREVIRSLGALLHNASTALATLDAENDFDVTQFIHAESE